MNPWKRHHLHQKRKDYGFRAIASRQSVLYRHATLSESKTPRHYQLSNSDHAYYELRSRILHQLHPLLSKKLYLLDCRNIISIILIVLHSKQFVLMILNDILLVYVNMWTVRRILIFAREIAYIVKAVRFCKSK